MSLVTFAVVLGYCFTSYAPASGQKLRSDFCPRAVINLICAVSPLSRERVFGADSALIFFAILFAARVNNSDADNPFH